MKWLGGVLKNPNENEERDLISYMEGPQDIPGKVLTARVKWTIGIGMNRVGRTELRKYRRRWKLNLGS